MIMKTKFFQLAFLLLLTSIVNAQYSNIIKYVAPGTTFYNLELSPTINVSSTVTKGDTFIVKYDSKKAVAPVTYTAASKFSATAKQLLKITKVGKETFIAIPNKNFVTIGRKVPGIEPTFLYQFTNGELSDVDIVFREGLKTNDSTFDDYIKLGRLNGYQPTGKILKEKWVNRLGSTLPEFDFNIIPDSSSIVTSLQVEPSVEEPHATRFRGYLFPITPGYYTFWVSADDAAVLLLSTDTLKQNVKALCYTTDYTKKGEWDKYPTQKSEPVYLNSTQKYYFELQHKDGGGGSQISLRWQLPTGTIEDISAAYFSPFPYYYDLNKN